jgi:branched-chain amino acid transport system substrate-binding protein
MATAMSGDIKKDRLGVRDALAGISRFTGITGRMTFNVQGDPLKCAVIVRINDTGDFEFYKSVCPGTA